MMKKLFLIITLTLVSFSINAQRLTYGVTAGSHSLIIRKKTDVLSGVFLGVFADIKLSEKFYIKPELQIAMTFIGGGTSFLDNPGCLISEFDSKSMLDIPIVAKYYLLRKFNVQAGTLLDFLLDGDDVPDNVRKFGFGLLAGLGYDFSKKIFATANYSFGLNSRNKNNKSAKIDIFQIGLGYRF